MTAPATQAIVLTTVITISVGAYYCFLRKKKSEQQCKQLRIVSLCPSTTLTLYDLGLSAGVVGRTRYCSKPDASYYAVPAKVGGTKDPQWDKIRELKPTHILFNMEENDYTHLSIAQDICETIVHTPTTINESIEMVLDLGRMFQVDKEANAIVDDIQNSLQTLTKKTESKQGHFTFLYFIWHTPNQRVASKGTYIDAMLTAAGGTNLATQINDERYPLMTEDFDTVADYCLLSTEPFPYKEKHLELYQKFGRECRIIDGEMLAWHGSKSAEGLRYLVGYFQQN